MEKEKKETKKNTKINEQVKVKKPVVKEEVRTSDKVIFTDEIRRIVKVCALILSFLAIIVCIFTFIFSIITSLKVFNISKTELLRDNFSVTFISNINGTSVLDAENIIEGYGSKALFVTFNVIIPAIAIVACSIILIILAKKAIDFVNSVTREKELYTKEKLNDIEKMACLFEVVLTISFVIFSRPTIILYLAVSLLLFILIALFKKCIELNK